MSPVRLFQMIEMRPLDFDYESIEHRVVAAMAEEAAARIGRTLFDGGPGASGNLTEADLEHAAERLASDDDLLEVCSRAWQVQMQRFNAENAYDAEALRQRHREHLIATEGPERVLGMVLPRRRPSPEQRITEPDQRVVAPRRSESPESAGYVPSWAEPLK